MNNGCIYNFPDGETRASILNGIRKIRLCEPHLRLEEDSGPKAYIEERLYAAVVNAHEQAVVDSIVDYLKTCGVNDITLIDEQFVKETFLNQLPVKPKRIMHEERLYDGYCCPRCYSKLMRDEAQKFCDNCGAKFDWRRSE